MPSFYEGYGLPMVEALTLGTPVIANDKAVFREVTQGCATYIDTLDGRSWRDAILELAGSEGVELLTTRAKAQAFRAPTWPVYFDEIERFLRTL